MKSFLRNMFAVFVSVLMMIGMGVTAFAADPTYTITITNTASGHTYEAYKIFSGEYDATLKDLSNIQWGAGVKDTDKLLSELRADATIGTKFTNAATAADVAAALSKFNNNSEDAKAFAQIVGQHLATVAGTSTQGTGNYTISNLAAGYYLVKDKDGSVKATENDAYTSFILDVVADVTATPKSSIPTVQKKVKDINDSTDTEKTDWQDSADYDIGDTVPFQLTGTLPNNYADYSTYKYTFHDVESTGLTFDSDSVKVTVLNGTVSTALASTDYSVVATGLTDGDTFEVRFDNLKAITDATINAASKITVEYNATLNKNAVLGSAGNPNKVNLEFSNNPNVGGEGNTGKTPDDTVIVFTYKTVINKVDSSNKPLAGAAFTLEKLYKGTGTDGADEWKTVEVTKNDAGTVFTFSGLDDGRYRLTETTTPSGYNTIDPIYFTVTADHEIAVEGNSVPTLKALSANQTAADGAALSTGTVATFAATADLSAGSLTSNVVNNTGATLPSTGGIGTTIFYVIGGAMVIAAGVLLVARKRSEN